MSAPAPKLSLFRQRLRSTFSQSPSSVVLNPGDVSDPTSTVLSEPSTEIADTVSLESPEPDLSSANPPVVTPTEITTDQKLEVLGSIISKLEAAAPVPQSEVESQQVVAAEPSPSEDEVVSVTTPDSVAPQTVEPPVQAQVIPAEPPVVMSPPPVHVSSLSKEAAPGVLAEQPVIEAGSGVQVVEYEPRSEMPVEVESFIQEIQDHQTEQPQEIVITDGQMQIQPAAVPKKSVIVLPITPETEAEGAKKSPKWSVRWLVEWSRKLMKAFSGRIIYREVSTEN